MLFPNEIISEVKIAKTRTTRVKGQHTDQSFDGLVLALEGWFDQNLKDIPKALQRRIEQEFFPNLWDRLSAEQRQRVAQQLDNMKNPDTKQEQQYWNDFFAQMDILQAQLSEWRSAETPTASDVELRQSRIDQLQQKLDLMESKKRRARGDYYVEPKHLDANMKSTVPADFIAYPMAMKILREKWQATPEELAVWISLGPEMDGIAAYLNANELSPPPMFSDAYSPVRTICRR